VSGLAGVLVEIEEMRRLARAEREIEIRRQNDREAVEMARLAAMASVLPKGDPLLAPLKRHQEALIAQAFEAETARLASENEKLAGEIAALRAR
jgi:hypothetical protein